MGEKKPYIIFLLVLSGLLASGIACHFVFPYPSLDSPTYDPYYCTATIYRHLPDGNQFTEQYNTYLWPDEDLDEDGHVNDNDASLLCANKVDEYITDFMAPGFTWNKRNISVYQATDTMNGVDCEDVEPVSPTYGGPWGSAISWQDPDGSGPEEIPQSEGYVWIKFTDHEDNIHVAEPYVEHALITLAERAGLSDSFGNYDRGNHHIRVSNLSLELKPFAIAGINVTTFHIHNIGSVITDGYGLYATFEPDTIKFFMYARGEAEGEEEVTRQCFFNDRGTGLGYVLYPHQHFIFQLDTEVDIGGLPLRIKIKLISPYGKKFNMHQPSVSLLAPDNWERRSPVDLIAYFAQDSDGDLTRFLWFENFESPDERFLGEGDLVQDVPFNVGEHKITAVAYDSQGSYNTASSLLTVKEPPIEVISPNGGECWETGSQQEIRWTSPEFYDPVRIMVSYEGHSPQFWKIIEDIATNDGSYIWTIPPKASKTCIIRIADADDSDPFGNSDAAFTISPPDDCVNAVDITDGQYNGTFACATSDGTATCVSTSDQPDVWYRYTARASGILSVNTCGTNDMGGEDMGIDTVLSVRKGCLPVPALEMVNGCNDDWPLSDDLFSCFGTDGGGTRDSALNVQVKTGQEILIRVAKYSDSPGNDFVLNVSLEIQGCPGDFNGDGDVDGDDLSELAVNPGWLNLVAFSPDFGRDDCL